MTAGGVGVDRSADTVTVTLDVPGRANALSPDVVAQLRHHVADAVESGVRALVLRGRGPVFCSGFDVSDASRMTDEVLAERFLAIEDLLGALASAPMLTVACVEGRAIGAGADLVVACDYRVGTPAAEFRFPGARFGVVLGTHRLSRLVGADAARELLVQQRRTGATEGYAVGLLSHLVSPEQAWPTVASLVSDSAGLDTGTLGELLRIIRGDTDRTPLAALQASVAAPGLADRLRCYLEHRRHAGRESSS